MPPAYLAQDSLLGPDSNLPGFQEELPSICCLRSFNWRCWGFQQRHSAGRTGTLLLACAPSPTCNTDTTIQLSFVWVWDILIKGFKHCTQLCQVHVHCVSIRVKGKRGGFLSLVTILSSYTKGTVGGRGYISTRVQLFNSLVLSHGSHVKKIGPLLQFRKGGKENIINWFKNTMLQDA